MSKRNRALPFIVQSSTDPSKYVLGDQACEMLSGISGRVAVIAVAGAAVAILTHNSSCLAYLQGSHLCQPRFLVKAVMSCVTTRVLA